MCRVAYVAIGTSLLFGKQCMPKPRCQDMTRPLTCAVLQLVQVPRLAAQLVPCRVQTAGTAARTGAGSLASGLHRPDAGGTRWGRAAAGALYCQCTHLGGHGVRPLDRAPLCSHVALPPQAQVLNIRRLVLSKVSQEGIPPSSVRLCSQLPPLSAHAARCRKV